MSTGPDGRKIVALRLHPDFIFFHQSRSRIPPDPAHEFEDPPGWPEILYLTLFNVFLTCLFHLALHIELIIQIQNIYYTMTTLNLIFIFMNKIVKCRVLFRRPARYLGYNPRPTPKKLNGGKTRSNPKDVVKVLSYGNKVQRGRGHMKVFNIPRYRHQIVPISLVLITHKIRFSVRCWCCLDTISISS